MSKDCFLALKVQIDCAFANLGLGGDIVHRRAMEAALEKYLARCVEDLLPALCLFPLPSLRRGHGYYPPRMNAANQRSVID
jgi:hypothetical protein